MKRLLFPLMLLCAIFSSFSQVSPPEKAALQALYNALDGPNWVSENDADPNNDWDFTGPVTNSWYGLAINSGAVLEIEMYQNNFSGPLPPEIGNLINLRVLRMEDGGITGAVPIETNQLTFLQRLEFRDNQITSIDVTGNPNLEWLDLGRNLINTIDVQQNILLTNLELDNNQLSTLDVSQNPQLYSLDFSDNSISSIDVSSNLALDNFSASNNLLTTLDVSNHPNLYQLIAPGNSLTSVDLTNSNIGYIYLYDNQLTSLDLSAQTYLEDLSIQNNFITTIDISGAMGLMGIDVSNNLLTELHVNDKDILFVLNASHNQILNLTLTNISSDLEDIDVSYNSLSDHSLVANFLSFPNLTDLDISNNDFRGNLPDTSLLPLNLFHFDNNRYQFGDLISHQSSSSAIPDYSNSPQAKLNTIDILNLPAGTNTTMVTNCSGAYNTYQWFKDGVAIVDGPSIVGSNSDTLTVNNLTGLDSGVYHCEVNSTAITGLTLFRNDVTLNVLTGPCDVRDRNALIAFYNATDGPNWINNTNWNTAAPLNTWYGVTTNAGGCVISLDMNSTNSIGSGNGLNGTLPIEIGYLFDLVQIDFYDQNLSGPLPNSIGNLTQLRNLDISFNQISGVIPSSIGNLTALVTLLFSQNQFTGPLPDEIGNLIELTHLFGQQNQLSGNLPSSLGNLTKLRDLWLYQNQFTGTIPASFSSLSSLEDLLLSQNELVGGIPEFWADLLTLENIWLSENQLTGTIPNSLSILSNLEQLTLQNNQLTGTIPISLANLASIEVLILGGNPLTGTIPPELGNLITLETLGIYDTQISGTLPPELGNLVNLELLWLLFNDIEGEIPDTYSNLINIKNLSFENNMLTGVIPPGFVNMTQIESFSIGDNSLEGPIPDFSGTPIDLNAFLNNKFQFGDFEDQFTSYSAISLFLYNPQAKVNEIENLNVNIGAAITLETTVNGSQNHYQWFKDGILIPGAPDSPTYQITNAVAADAGVYHCEITSDIVTDLTLIRNDITLSVGCISPTADDPEDVTACESYTLPALSIDNNYYTATNAGGTRLNAGDIVTTLQTIYVHTGSIDCSDENSFIITIDPIVTVDTIDDVSQCESYLLPTLTSGSYFSESAGQGTELFTGDSITNSQTIYIYFESGTCSDESSFEVTIDPSECEEEPTDTCKLKFPKFFTPNNDGVNDHFRVMENPCSIVGNLSIYDRYGKLIYQTDITSSGWDGTFEGVRLPSTDYWYQFINAENGQVSTGHFSLKR